ncbi:MAG TPA: OmpA family protein [Flavobacteriales bacterium]|nr:OmpA family protein [Flavobacteriales bacterium]
MKRINTITALLLAGSCAFAQVKKADRLFDQWAYYDAAKCYKKEADKNSTPEINYKLGQCYQKMLKYAEAKDAYDRVAAAGRFDDPMFYYNYGLVLKNNENYDEAIEAFAIYQQMNPGDMRAEFYRNSCEVIIAEMGTDLPIPVKGVSSINDEYASFCPVNYKDGILFTSSQNNARHNKTYAWNGQPYYDVYFAPRASNISEFHEENQFDKLINKKYSDGPTSFSKNFDTIYFNRIGKELRGADKRDIGIETNKIFYATLDEDGDWENVTAFEYNSKDYSVASPFITKDGSRIYFSSDMPGGYGQADIYFCYKQNNGWSEPVNLGAAINTFGNEKFPMIDDDGTLYFSSDGYKGYGSLDIIVARNTAGSFEAGQVLKAPLNSAGDDYSITFVESGRSGYISSVRRESNGDADIFSFSIDDVPCIENVADYVIGFRCEEPVTAEIIDTLEPVLEEDLSLEKVIDLRIHFDFDKSFIRADAVPILDSVLTYMKDHPNLEAEINAHCDCRGTDAYNMALGNRRAASTKRYLESRGIAPHRLKPYSFGERQLLNNCYDGVECSEAQHQVNRRVQFVFRKQLKPDTSLDMNKK